jgi:hypothetical protein
MGGLGAIYAASLVLTVLMIASSGVVQSLVSSYSSLVQGTLNGDYGVRLEGVSLLNNGTHLLASFRNAGTGSIRASEFLRSDVVLRYRKVDGGKATLVLRCCDGWRLVEVSLNGKEELLNPVDVEAGKGVIDPGETATIAVPVQQDMDPDGPVMVLVVTPQGSKGVVTK